MKIAVTGAGGLIGWHACARLHAVNCAARFKGEPAPYQVMALDRAALNDDAALAEALSSAGIVLHIAGINQASEEEQEQGNIAIAERLAAAIDAHAPKAIVAYSNSIHEAADNPYGRGKRRAAEVLAKRAEKNGTEFINIILPHIFGEGGRPFYNNVTGTLSRQIIDGETPTINPEGRVELVHAGDAAQEMIDLSLAGKSTRKRMDGREMTVADLYEKLVAFHKSYMNFVFPELSEDFDVALFNTYRQHLYPDGFPKAVKVNTDARGRLFECVKGGSGGQTFISWTEPGVTRGEHFHLTKIERFLVVEGEASIAVRKVLTDEIHSFSVNGDEPTYVDMPTLWTHNITNTGMKPLVTLFWTHDLFDPTAPDTYADKVDRDTA